MHRQNLHEERLLKNENLVGGSHPQDPNPCQYYQITGGVRKQQKVLHSYGICF
jgi:hypothetical protein